MENPLRTARLAVVPHLSHRRAAAALGCALSTLYTQEKPDFDPAKLSMTEIEARTAVYGCTIPQLLGREPLQAKATA